MANYTAKQIASYIIRFCNEHGDVITNLKLQKLLYYAQAWHLAIYGKVLFSDDIEAWTYGPVVYSIYKQFQHFEYKPIVYRPKPPVISSRAKNLIRDVMETYGDLSAFQLERLTHQEKPWREARGDLPADALSRDPININTMRDFYKAMIGSFP